MRSLLDKRIDLLIALLSLTLLFILMQFVLFVFHYKINDIIDSLVHTSISSGLFYPIVILPIILFFFIQALAYALMIAWIWFITISVGEFFQLSKQITFWMGIGFWCLSCITILMLNSYYFPHSFFASFINEVGVLKNNRKLILLLTLFIGAGAALLAYTNFFLRKRYHWLGILFLLLGVSYSGFLFFDQYISRVSITSAASAKHQSPDIILIGLDSLRPDFTGYFGNTQVHTPYIDKFLNNAVTFNHAYTPLARTFPAWMSILTAKYPKHNEARNNLINPYRVLQNNTLAKHLHQYGYFTIYATDEKRFSNITLDYGFERIIGPPMGVNDFLLGGLADFPLTNLLTRLPFGAYIFPFNYGNRAAAITYEPDHFLQLIQNGLRDRPRQPLFLAIHLCLAHWPFTWAQDGQKSDDKMPNLYKKSVEGIDTQFNKLLQLLKENRLLENSVVVLLSDHGTGLGLLGDRFISEKNYIGDIKQLSLIPASKLSLAPRQSVNDKRDYTINTSYGQGTNILSLKQYQVLLAFKSYGNRVISWSPQRMNEVSSLIDIAPTLLAWLKLPAMENIDGISLHEIELHPRNRVSPRAIFMETGDSLTEIETDHIYIEKVIKHEIGIYHVHPQNGLLIMDKEAEQSMIKNKQRAILWGDWLLARFPAQIQNKKFKSKLSGALVSQSYVVPAYFVLSNLKTGLWTIGLASPFTRTAPVASLHQQLKMFFGNEI